ncbi:IS630 transposase-related protein [Bacteroides caecimuris]|uniref:IS630 transposase-related protein n=1 Tax=Bacteroides caecimuris TaxID=1796613 RepID=UPI00336BF444
MKETGNLEKKDLHRSFRKIDPEKLKAYVVARPDAYQLEMAKASGCSESGIRDALRRHKITRKKDGQLPGAGPSKSSGVSERNQRYTAGKDRLCG